MYQHYLLYCMVTELIVKDNELKYIKLPSYSTQSYTYRSLAVTNQRKHLPVFLLFLLLTHTSRSSLGQVYSVASLWLTCESGRESGCRNSPPEVELYKYLQCALLHVLLMFTVSVLFVLKTVSYVKIIIEKPIFLHVYY